jgi:hypothetical protein
MDRKKFSQKIIYINDASWDYIFCLNPLHAHTFVEKEPNAEINSNANQIKAYPTKTEIIKQKMKTISSPVRFIGKI